MWHAAQRAVKACCATSSIDAGVAADGETAAGGGASSAPAGDSSSRSVSARLTPPVTQCALVRVWLILSLLPSSLRPAVGKTVGQSVYGLSFGKAVKVMDGITPGLSAWQKPLESGAHFQWPP